jgi:hypothetical protein
LFSITLNAQTDFSFGPKIGYKSNYYIRDLTVSDPFIADFKDISDITLGAYGRLMFDKFIIQPELIYNYIAIDAWQCTGPVTILKNHSFSIPVYFGYQFINRDNFNMRATAGPIVHFNIDYFIESMYQQLNYRFMNLGAALNLGVDIYRFTIDLGYSLGFTNVFHNIDNPNIRQNSLTFTVGYRFGK